MQPDSRSAQGSGVSGRTITVIASGTYVPALLANEYTKYAEAEISVVKVIPMPQTRYL